MGELITFKKYYVTIMLLFKILLSFLIFINSNFLLSLEGKLQNIRFSDNHQNNSFRVVLDLTHKVAYTVFSLDKNTLLRSVGQRCTSAILDIA